MPQHATHAELCHIAYSARVPLLRTPCCHIAAGHAVAASAAAFAAACSTTRLHCRPGMLSCPLTAHADAAPAQAQHPLAQAALGAAAGPAPAVGGLHGRHVGRRGACLRSGTWTNSCGSPQRHAQGSKRRVCLAQRGPLQYRISAQTTAGTRPPDGLPSSASTVSATLHPSACWLYLHRRGRLESSEVGDHMQLSKHAAPQCRSLWLTRRPAAAAT